MQVKIKRLHPDAKIPTYATDGSACFDLYAASHYVEEDCSHTFNIGLAFEIPEDHVMLVFSRSGFGFKNGATLCNSTGVVDSDFRGAVQVKYNKRIQAGVGDRIAQAMIIPVERIEFELSETLSETKRGQNGFGSSGVK